MNSAITATALPGDAAGAATRLAQVALARIAAAAATEGQVIRDLLPMLPSVSRSFDWQPQIQRLIAALVAMGHVERSAQELVATADGRQAVVSFVGNSNLLAAGWPAMRDDGVLMAALGMSGAPASRCKAAKKLDGLRALIVEAHFKLRLKGKPSASRIRHALAMLALERAFGNQIKNELGARSSLSSKASRLLAGQLSLKPRDFGTDARLVAALAAEAVCVKRSDIAQLRAGVLKAYLKDVAILAVGSRTGAETATAVERPRAPPLPRKAQARPDLAGFVAAVKSMTNACAEGWPGNRRAFVSHVWDQTQKRYAGWALSEIEFKAMLTEAHRSGLIVLANADLKDKRHLGDVQASAITYKNTVWHYIRADE